MIVDANVLLGAMLGTSVWRLHRVSAAGTPLLAPMHQMAETRAVLRYRLEGAVGAIERRMEALAALVDEIEPGLYLPFEARARARIDNARSRDWPVLAAAMALDDEIWSNDRDFFGVGVAVWSTHTLDLALRDGSDV